jgi:hypothetical protein
MVGNLVEQIILNRLIKWSTMELEDCLNKFLHILGQLFHIENILINDLPLQIEPIAIKMCSKMKLITHAPYPNIPLPLGKNSQHPSFGLRSKAWHVGMTMVGSFSKLTKVIAKLNAYTTCHHLHKKFVPHFLSYLSAFSKLYFQCGRM